MTAAFLALIAIGEAQERAFQRNCEVIRAEQARRPPPPPGTVLLTRCDREPQRAIEIAIQLNLPVLGVALFALVLHGRTQDVVGYLFVAAAGTLLWFYVGYSIDRFRSQLRASRFAPAIASILGVVGVFSIPAALGTWSGHVHHGWVFPFGLIIWPAAIVLVLYYRRKSPAALPARD